MGCRDSSALNPQAIDIIFKPQSGRKEGRQPKAVVIPGHPAIHAPVLVRHHRAEIHQGVVVVQVFDLDLVLILQEEIHEVDRVDIVGAGAECLGDFDHRSWRDATGFQEEGILPRDPKCGIGLKIHRGVDNIVADEKIPGQLGHGFAKYIGKARQQVE